MKDFSQSNRKVPKFAPQKTQPKCKSRSCFCKNSTQIKLKPKPKTKIDTEKKLMSDENSAGKRWRSQEFFKNLKKKYTRASSLLVGIISVHSQALAPSFDCHSIVSDFHSNKLPRYPSRVGAPKAPKTTSDRFRSPLYFSLALISSSEAFKKQPWPKF